MPANIEDLRCHLQAFDFPSLFVEGLGWNHYQAEPLIVLVNDREYSLNPVAEKAHFVVYECAPDQDGAVPLYPVRRKIESQVAKRAFEHLVVFVNTEKTIQVWQWVKREGGKPAACREQQYHKGQGGEPLLQRLSQIAFNLDEELGLNISTVAARVSRALDVEKVTKRFYERFRTELAAFGNFIDGIAAEGDRGHYASLMLNRMMFVYFVQKQGFLDGDTDYLRNRLRMLKNESGGGRFQQFYRIFLLRLFHEGLGQSEGQRPRELAALLGKVPFLNGGLFDVHDLERDNHDISIPDEAFERVFDFFDAYRWHLDERPYREDNEINPDVLGYIFEKYVNQKQMGAYYTKEDITGYISRNTVIPFLFDAARKECLEAFGPNDGVWNLLRDEPDRYIYPAVGHGITWNARDVENPIRLESSFELPDEIAVGIDDVSKRNSWNGVASDDYALPTETWREVVVRRQRHAQVRAKLASGEVQSVNDLITLNLDIERFAEDAITQCEGPELLRALWHSLYGNRECSDTGISVLDPTCGSGAFLFAALNVLEPLYTACLEGMRGFLDDAERSERKCSPGHLGDFRRILEQVGKHSSERYFILKSIVLNNLYGVDIMEEAVEICKLRLFLKLVAQLQRYDQIEPLPDIDFNVRVGNTLVGFTSLDTVREAMTIMPNGQHRQVFPEDQAAIARIEEEADIASAAFNQFRWQQTTLDGKVNLTATDKADLRLKFESLSNALDRYLATEYGIRHSDTATYDAWCVSHQPFHWFVEFYGIMSKGGFDVVIGNPPYVEYRKVKSNYSVRGYATEQCANLYAFVMEQSSQLLCESGCYGMIVPAGVLGLGETRPLRDILFARFPNVLCSTYAIRPSKLFEGVDQRLCIVLANSASAGEAIKTTRYHHWNAEERSYLFALLSYVGSYQHSRLHRVPQLGSPMASQVLVRLERMASKVVGSYYAQKQQGSLLHYHRSPRYWIRAMNFEQYFRSATRSRSVHHFRNLYFGDARTAKSIGTLLNSSLFFLWFVTIGNGRNITGEDVTEFPVGNLSDRLDCSGLFDELMDDYRRHAIVRHRVDAEFQEFYPSKSKKVIDQIDRVLAEHYGFTDEELDFIINYDIKYRIGREG